MLGQSPTAHATGTAVRVPGPPSSSGPGHRPFKAAARVRIPLGVPAHPFAGAAAARNDRVTGRRRPRSRPTHEPAGGNVFKARTVAVRAKQGPVEQLGVLVTLSR